MKKEQLTTTGETVFVGNGVEETTELRTTSIATVKQWLLDERPDLDIPEESKLILYFLRTTKYDIDKAKRKLKIFLKNREKLTEWFRDRDPFRPEIQELLDIGVFLPLHEKDSLNRQVVIIRTSAHDPEKHKQDDVFKVDKMILDLLMYLDETVSIHGVVAIFDMQGVTLGHALQMTPSIIKKSVESWENYPCKPKLLEFVNVPVHVNVVLNVFRSFMSAKMRERITISRKGSSLEQSVTLPLELGGNGESYYELSEYWKRTVQENARFYSKMEENVFHL